MEESLINYLNKNYALNESSIVHIHFGGKSYGKQIAEEITLIFSVKLTMAETLVKEWIKTKIVGLDKLEVLWDKCHHRKYFEPKRANRFLLTFPEEFQVPQYLVSTTIRPSATFNNGNVEWLDIEIVLRDPIGPSMTERMHELFLRINSPYTNREFQYKIEMLDPTGVSIEEWTIRGIVTRIDFGQLDYSSDEQMDIKLYLRPTSCILNF